MTVDRPCQKIVFVDETNINLVNIHQKFCSLEESLSVIGEVFSSENSESSSDSEIDSEIDSESDSESESKKPGKRKAETPKTVSPKKVSKEEEEFISAIQNARVEFAEVKEVLLERLGVEKEAFETYKEVIKSESFNELINLMKSHFKCTMWL